MQEWNTVAISTYISLTLLYYQSSLNGDKSKQILDVTWVGTFFNIGIFWFSNLI